MSNPPAPREEGFYWTAFVNLAGKKGWVQPREWSDGKWLETGDWRPVDDQRIVVLSERLVAPAIEE